MAVESEEPKVPVIIILSCSRRAGAAGGGGGGAQLTVGINDDLS